MDDKVDWSGAVTGVQPRIRLTRSFDERSHSYLGYLLRIEGTVGGIGSVFRVAVGSTAPAKYQFQVGDSVQGVGHRVADPRLEIAEIYKVSKLRISRSGPASVSAAPWHGVCERMRKGMPSGRHKAGQIGPTRRGCLLSVRHNS
jgi:hypothetical protein